jgi:hypothetical protein
MVKRQNMRQHYLCFLKMATLPNGLLRQFLGWAAPQTLSVRWAAARSVEDSICTVYRNHLGSDIGNIAQLSDDTPYSANVAGTQRHPQRIRITPSEKT